MSVHEPEKKVALDAEYLSGRRFPYQEDIELVEEVDVADEADVLLVRKPMSREVLGIESGRLLGLVDAQSGTASSTCDGR